MTGGDGPRPPRPEAIDLLALRLAHEPLPPDLVRDGAPEAGAHVLHDDGDVEIGVWEHTAGTSTDVEADEAFVVLAGRGELTVDGGVPVALRPGCAVRLRAGQRTVWRVDEPLRKLYVAGPGAARLGGPPPTPG